MKKLFQNLMFAIILVATSTTVDAQWDLSGNNLNANNKFLGTKSTSLFKDLIIKTNSAEVMRIKGVPGPNYHYIGIGMNTTTMPDPLNQFHVHDGTIRITGQNASGGPMILFGGTATTSVGGEWGIEYTNATANTGLNFWKPFGSTNGGGNYFMFLSDNGNVGINTDNPTARFTVNGKTLMGDPALVNINTIGNYNLYVQNGILTEKLRVAVVNSATWADYVFAEDYKLQSLKEVAAFIEEYNHLPGVPSAKEVEKEGVDMVEMDATLLSKIEELTLYIIEQDKRIALLEQK
jgi:hypothetical protein